jgi:hypothetical protein
MNKYEQLIEHIVNDDEAKARALFHAIVVERSREIYESLMDEEQPGVSHDAVGGLVDEISMDETGMHEEEELGMPGDDMGGAPGDDMGDMGGDLGGDMGGDSEAPATKSDIMDLESAIDELKAEFDRLMGDEGSDDMGGEEDFGSEEGEDEEGGEEEGGENPFGGADDEEADDEEADDEEKVAESRRPKTEAERIREYVDRVGHDWDKGAQKGPKGENVGTGAKSERQGEKNTKSIIDNMKNDMGGTNANMNRRAEETNPDGQTPSGKAGGFLKPAQEIDVAKRNVNKPGGNKGAQNYYDGKANAKKSGEEGGTNTNSPLNGAPGRAK